MRILPAAIAVSILIAAPPGFLLANDAVDFNRDIRPILSRNCAACHGQDEKQRQAGLRLDVRSSAVAVHDGSQAIVPGNAKKSELVRRVSTNDADERMPPSSTGKRLTATEIDQLSRWIGQGAVYSPHWAYVKPVRPAVPPVHDAAWPHNDIDRFLLARLEQEKLRPSPTADRNVLIRRLALDLTGLPPTVAEVDAFVHDKDPAAYEKLVDRLMARETFGEHWARMWLDLARYADSAGYVSDVPRTIWAYRDYVIRAFNSDKPFDRFTIEQVAGNLLPNPTEEQLIATAFHRNTQTNNEGGSDREEYRNVAIVDRVNTTMSVWMGTTMACCQCHDHKYDPITQKEYFRLFAIFNNTEDADREDEHPVLSFYTERQKRNAQTLQEEIAALEPQVPVEERTPPPSPRPAKPPGKKKAKKPPVIAAAASAVSATAPSATATRVTRTKPPMSEKGKRLLSLKAELAAISPATVPIQRELPPGKRRKTYIEYRGNFLDRGPEVTEGLPAAFHPLPKDEPVNRLTLAKWLVARDNPLTARVLVNRLWEKIFGVGIVATSEDFGTQGELPSHPELLDYLATELVASGWDMKHMIRIMVTSAAYRQSSVVAPELRERDPDNRLLARGPRFRLDAEAIRDQSLAVSGLLSPKMFGPAVRPLQPSFGLTAAFGKTMDWQTSTGEDRYRRAIYTAWRRTNPYPSMVTFDSPSREVCSLRRTRTNTPLQALVTLNDPVYVEAAQALARRLVQEGGPTAAGKVRYAFRLCLARAPSGEETARLVALYEKSQDRFAARAGDARKLAGEPQSGPADAAQVAAWTAVSNVFLNLDEFLMRR